MSPPHNSSLIIEHEQAAKPSFPLTGPSQQQQQEDTSRKARPAPCSIRFDQASSAQRAGRWGSKSAHLCLTCSGRDVLRAADRCWEPTNDDEDTTKACAGASSATAVATEAVTFMTTAVVFVEKRRERGVCRMLAAGTLLGQSEGPLIATKFSICGGGGIIFLRAAHTLFCLFFATPSDRNGAQLVFSCVVQALRWQTNR